MSTISIVVNTYNADRILDKCLNSVRFADEIVLCDMYSTDKTIEIAKKYNCKIVFHQHTGIVEPARNFALNQATSNWILVLDADEIVTPELWNKLYSIACNPVGTIYSYLIPKETFFIGKSVVKERACKRFWKNGTCVYPGTNIHEAIITKEGGEEALSGFNEKILHYHVSTISDLVEKNDRYTSFELPRFEAKGKRFSLFMLVFRPFFEFVKFFIFSGGFLSGVHGYIFAKMNAQYKFLQWAKLYEKEFKENNTDLNY